ncbi:sensor histidine kinase [Brevundimonas sp.]|uniref:sensor histidine kinase n=1 Tax=Brevundimonas sp. TaxID=1871086 RepID=UPI003F700672
MDRPLPARAPRPVPPKPAGFGRFTVPILWTLHGWLAMFFLAAGCAKLTEDLALLTLLMGWPGRAGLEMVRTVGWIEVGLAMTLIAALTAERWGRIAAVGAAAQRAFSANAAHEPRTPLTILRAHVESLLPPEERGVATAEFERLARLIEQLLFLAEADRDRLSRTERFDLVAVARDVAAEMTPRILTGGREIGFDSAVERVARQGDAVLAGVAVRNLIENAVRHTPPGTTIAISVDATGAVTVRDDGPGVPEAFEARLYDRFARADSKGDGAGLGLSITARIIELHGGTVRFQRPDKGAGFVPAFADGA